MFAGRFRVERALPALFEGVGHQLRTSRAEGQTTGKMLCQFWREFDRDYRVSGVTMLRMAVNPDEVQK
jgi:hypothetical protein